MVEAFRIIGRIALEGGQQVSSELGNLSGDLNKSESKWKKFGRSVGKVTRAVAVAGVSALSAIGGAIGGIGIQHNAMLEQSKVAWTTLLGTAEDAETMLKRISDFTKSTPFDTASVDMMAKYMHNAGLEGDALFDQLMKIADTASAFSVPAAEAQEMSRQMSQVMQAGVAYTEDLNVLADRGIPIQKAIAENLGITVGEVKNLASEGKLTADIYMAAFDSISKSVEGASKDQSETFNGMISTLKDNIAIFSGSVMEDLFTGALKPALQGAVQLFEDLNKIVESDGLRGLADHLFPKWLVDFVIRASKEIKGAFEIFVDYLPTLQKNFKKVWDKISDAISLFIDYLPTLQKAFSEVWTVIVDVVEWVADIVVPVFQDMIQELQDFWDQHGSQFLTAIQNYFKVIAAIFMVLFPIIKYIVETVLTNVLGVIQGIFTAFMGIVKIFTGLFTGDFALLWEGLLDLFSGAIQAIWDIFNLLFIGRILAGIKYLALIVVSAFVTLFFYLVDKAKTGVQNVLLWIKDLKDKAISFFMNLRDKAVDLWNQLKDEVIKRAEDLKTKAVDIATKIYDGIKNKFDELLSKGKSIFEKLRDAVTKPIETARKTIQDIVDKIKGYFTDLKIKLPSIKMPKLGVKNWSKNPADWISNPPKLSISWHKQGGFFDGPSVIGVGEKGREAVLPLENMKYLRPFSQAIASQLTAIQGGQSSLAVSVPVILNDREIARAMTGPLNREMERTRRISQRMKGV